MKRTKLVITVVVVLVSVLLLVLARSSEPYKRFGSPQQRLRDHVSVSQDSVVPGDEGPLSTIVRGSARSARSTTTYPWFWTSFSGFDVKTADNGPTGTYYVNCCKLNDRFLQHIPICAVHAKDYKSFKYWILQIAVRHPTTKAVKSMYVYCMDMCVDSDCVDEPNCCSNNARFNKRKNFVIDLERNSCRGKLGFDPMKYLLAGVARRVMYIPKEQFMARYGISLSYPSA